MRIPGQLQLMQFSGPKPYRLDLLGFSGLNVMVLAPHPDDFDAIGVTMRKLRDNGNSIQLEVLSSGSGVEDSFCSPPTFENKAAIREQEQRESCRFFGLPECCLEFPPLELDAEAQPLDSPANTALVLALIERSKPDLVFLPHGNDTNSGHRQVWAMSRRAAGSFGRPLTAFYNHDPKTISLRVDALMVFDDDLAPWKGELLRFHRSQQHRNLLHRGYGLDERILRTNRKLAQDLGFPGKLAEGFELEHFGATRPAP